MTYVLVVPMFGHYVHLGIQNGRHVVQAHTGNTVLQYIPQETFGNQHDFDLPAELIDASVHVSDNIRLPKLPGIHRTDCYIL